MKFVRAIKLVILSGSAIGVICWLALTNRSPASASFAPPPISAAATGDDADYVGTEACKDCHEDQFKAFSHTSHAQLTKIKSWKGKVTGCEACHGPGKAHIEDGDPAKIISFKKKSSKETSETCLSCHAGKEERNNFRRGEHWRNDIGCTDCHSSHSTIVGRNVASSNYQVTTANAEKPGFAHTAMLRSNDPQLCIGCHNEVKPQFNMPFHHKVLEGAMQCSDCHNPHGGFEQKQTKLAVGADQACARCHSNKQGPFVFEHAPLKIEGCATCHSPHGSSNAKMLKRAQVRQTCIECHTGIHEELSPQLPSRHNQAQFREQQCTVCHSAIHGSNSSRLFFR